MAVFCTACGTQNPETSTFCTNCGKPMAAGTAPGAGPVVTSSTTPTYTATPAATPAGAGLADNVAGALAYITIIPAIIFLLIEPYNRSRFVRFHAWQCIWLCIAAIVLRLAAFFIPGMFMVHLVFRSIISLLLFVGWLIAIINAGQGKIFKLPLIGDLAESQAGR